MKKNKLPSVIILIILTTITTLFWISFTIYRVFTKPDKIEIPAEIILDINPTLDKEIINSIESRI